MQKLNIARKELLDLSLKNPLLNFKLRKTTGLEFSCVNANDVMDYLVNEGKFIFFSREKSNFPSKLYVDIEEKDLRSRLNRTYRSSRLFIEEKGANILFLTLGFLFWKENEEENFYKSPLVLVPVELMKTENMDRYYIAYSGEEVRLNISLIHKLSTEFGVDIAYEVDEIEDIDKYFRFLYEKLSVAKPDWKLSTTTAALDFFSYSKFLMYRDLNIDVWQDDNKKLHSDIFDKLFVSDFSEEKQQETTLPSYHVVDADTSQALAISDVQNGKNIVLQGPPGTGKSQTITNMIASAIGNGKSVLFVSEKMAALDVVKKRLENVGLGDLVLELHSQKTNKKDVLKSIEKTLGLGEPKVDDARMLFHKHDTIQNDLNQYREILNSPLKKSNLPLIYVYGEALLVKEKIEKENVRLPRLIFKNIEKWSYDDYKKRLDLLNEFIALLNRIGKIEKNPLFGITLKSCLPYEQVTLKEKLIDLEECLNTLIHTINEIGIVMGNKSCNTLFDSKRLKDSIEVIEKYQDIGDINCSDQRFANRKYVENIIESCMKLQKFYKENVDYNSIAFDKKQDFVNLYQKYLSNNKRKKDLELLTKMREFLQDERKEDVKYERLYNHIQNYQIIYKNERILKELFSTSYIGIYETNWLSVQVSSKKAATLHEMISNYRIVSQAKVLIKEPEKIKTLQDLKNDYYDIYIIFVKKLEEFLKVSAFDSYLKFNYSSWYLDLTFNELKKVIGGWKNHIDYIADIVNYNALTARCKELDLDPILELVPTWKNKNEYFADMLSYEYFDTLIYFAYEHYPLLNEFKKYKADRMIDMFKELDLKVMVENIKFILKKHWEQMPKMNDTTSDMALIRREIQKKRNHMPIRKLLSSAKSSILKIKPVFMMSPISIATFLEPKEVVFDLVIFDEASQVRPVEAFGALLRAKQIVIVGDSKQLPPTSFFDTMTSKYDELVDEDYDIANMESILSLLLAKNIQQRTLTWHYRSKHQSLIMVSNSEFYQQSLKIFPSIQNRNSQEGLVFHYLPKTSYDRGGTRSNVLEAKEVIKAVFLHAKQHPNMSLGVASFSISQQEELYREFDRQIKKCTDENIKNFFSNEKIEPFFIKNLENVQGDERDVIFISIGYGYDQNHKIAMDFGPLNKDGGERRLNVLITRAKYKCVVFSNITSHDINLAKTNALGVAALKKFLEYAQTRTLLKERVNEIEVDTFVSYLYEKLLEYGFEADKSVGKNVGIDIAIYDKEKQCYVVGIECDGGINKVLKSATDRERIRRNVLKSLGWNLYHLWTPDYYKNPKMEFEQLLEYIHDAMQNEEIREIQPLEAILIKRKQTEPVKVKPNYSTTEYKQFHSIKRRVGILDEDETLISILDKIVKCESPVHFDIIKRRIMQTINVSRLNEQNTNHLKELLNGLENVLIEDNFYFYKDEPILIRNRSNLENYEKKVDYISKKEIHKLILEMLNVGAATTKEEVYKEVAVQLGFNKNSKLNEMCLTILNELFNQKIIYEENDIIFMNDK